MNVAAITSFLEQQLGDDLVAAFVYGSVAAGRAHPGSDIDCFVITAGELGEQQRRRIRADFAALQRSLGFVPDRDYPIELFSEAACEAILARATLNHVLTIAARTGCLVDGAADCDDVEVLRALLDRRLTIRDAAALDRLTARAWALLDRDAAGTATVLRALRLAEDPR